MRSARAGAPHARRDFAAAKACGRFGWVQRAQWAPINKCVFVERYVQAAGAAALCAIQLRKHERENHLRSRHPGSGIGLSVTERDGTIESKCTCSVSSFTLMSPNLRLRSAEQIHIAAPRVRRCFSPLHMGVWLGDPPRVSSHLRASLSICLFGCALLHAVTCCATAEHASRVL